MLRSSWQRRNEPFIIALGHYVTEGEISADVVLVGAHMPEHDVELIDDLGQSHPVEVPEDWFDAEEPRILMGVQLSCVRGE